MHFKLRLIPTAVATLLVAACGGGGGGSSTVAANPSSGTVVDGYLNFAKVVCDANENGVYDTGEQVSYTSNNGDGKFTFNPGCAHSILGGVDGTGTNADTNLPFVGLLRAPAGATVLTPLTTLLSSGMSAAEVVKALDLPAGTNLLTVDPAATNSDGSLKDAELLKKSIAVQQLLQKTTEVVNKLAKMTGSEATQSVYTQVATALATTLKSGAVLIAGGATPVMDAAVVKSMLSTAFTNIGSAASIDPVIKTALSGAGGAVTLPTVINAALTGQAQVILGASAATITATTLDRQSNNIIASTVTAAVDAKTLSPSTSPAALSTLATTTNTAAAVATVVPPPPVVVAVPAPAAGSTTLFTFDEASPLFTNMGAYGGALPSVVVPDNSNAGNALKIVKTAGPDSGGGTYFGLPAIPFTASRKQITAAVFSSVANAVILLKAEVTSSDSVEVASTPTGAANTWSTVTWDLSAVDPAKAYATMAITPSKGLTASGQTYYLDNIALAPAGVTPPPPVLPKAGVLATFDETVSLPFLGFNGADGSSIKAAPAGGGSGLALNVLRTGGDPWAGAKVTVGAMDVSSTNTTITAKVYSPLAGIPIVLKLEGATNALTTSEIQATETVVTGWQTLSWVIPTAQIKSGYSNVILLPHLNTTASVSPGESYFFDDIRLGVAVTPPTPAPLTDYLYIPGDSIGFAADGVTANAVNYTMAAFQSSGINVKWPMANGAAIKLNLAVNGTFNFAAGQKLSAAVQIEDTTVGSSGQIRAYTDNVAVSKSGDTITLSVPSLPQALIYGVSADGATKAVIDFASSVNGISNALSTAANAVSTVMFGEVVNFGITGLSNRFTNMNALRGKYKVTVVVNQLPLRKANGSAYDAITIQVPTTVSGNTEGGLVPVTGAGLVGYINLTN
jgi:hypothetical protein